MDLLLNHNNDYDKARLLAASAKHSADWLNTLTMTSCGLRLDDEAVRVVVSLRLGVDICQHQTCVDICQPHTCVDICQPHTRVDICQPHTCVDICQPHACVDICQPHTCFCGAAVDVEGLHALSCKCNNGRIIRHNNLNDIILHSLTRANIPVTKEHNGLFLTNGK